MRNTNVHKIISTGIFTIFGIINFGSCITLNPYSLSVAPGQTSQVAGGTCVRFTSNVSMNNVSYLNGNSEVIANPTSNNELYCFDQNGYIKSNSTIASMDFQIYDPSDLFSGYVLESTIDTNYCVENDLCPVPENFSQLYINEIEHQSAPVIKVTIPEEIERDSNVDSGEFNLDIVGYGYDQDKMQTMVNTQYYKPTPEEMSGLIEKIAEFLPLVAVAILVIRIRRVLKKVFRF